MFYINFWNCWGGISRLINNFPVLNNLLKKPLLSNREMPLWIRHLLPSHKAFTYYRQHFFAPISFLLLSIWWNVLHVYTKKPSVINRKWWWLLDFSPLFFSCFPAIYLLHVFHKFFYQPRNFQVPTYVKMFPIGLRGFRWFMVGENIMMNWW